MVDGPGAKSRGIVPGLQKQVVLTQKRVRAQLSRRGLKISDQNCRARWEKGQKRRKLFQKVSIFASQAKPCMKVHLHQEIR